MLLLDEPTANLDILHQLKVLNLIRESLNGGLTAIAAIHDLSMAARYCDRLALLSDGRVVAEGAPEEVLTPGRIEAAYGVRAAGLPRSHHERPCRKPYSPRDWPVLSTPQNGPRPLRFPNQKETGTAYPAERAIPAMRYADLSSSVFRAGIAALND